MKTYIKVWAVIILVANILVFGYLTATDGDLLLVKLRKRSVLCWIIPGSIIYRIAPGIRWKYTGELTMNPV